MASRLRVPGRLRAFRPGPKLRQFGVRIILYLACGAWLYHAVLVHPATVTLESGQHDAGLFIWWLEWARFALAHGLNPLYTHYWNAPTGIDAMWNTSILAIGFLFSPVTALFGPIVTLNVIAILGPALSALTASYWLGRYVRPRAAVVGGLIFGFSPFVVQHGTDHMHMTWLALVPIMAMLVEDLAWRAPRPAWQSGLLLGFAATAQWFISSEVLVIAGLGAAVMLAVLAAFHPTRLGTGARNLLIGGSVAVAVVLVLCGPALWDQFVTHPTTGPLQPPFHYEIRPSYLINPPASMLFHTRQSAALAGQIGGENGMYLGLPLLVALAVSAFLLRVNRAVVVSAVVAVVFFVLALGGDGPHGPHTFRAYLPWTGLGRWSPLQSLIPARFGLVVWMAAAFLIATSIDAVAHNLPNRKGTLLIGVTLITLIPLVPVAEPVGRIEPVPSFFTTSAVHIIPQGSNVLLVPMPIATYDIGYAWQAESHFRFAQPASLAITGSGKNRTATFAPDSLVLFQFFGILAKNDYFRGPWSISARQTVIDELAHLHTVAVVVGQGPTYAKQVKVVQELFVRPADVVEGGVSLWWVPPTPTVTASSPGGG